MAHTQPNKTKAVATIVIAACAAPSQANAAPKPPSPMAGLAVTGVQVPQHCDIPSEPVPLSTEQAMAALGVFMGCFSHGV